VTSQQQEYLMDTINLARVCVNQQMWIDLTPEVVHLNQLLEQLNMATGHVAVAVNNHIVNQQQWAQQVLVNNDQISVFGAIAGG